MGSGIDAMLDKFGPRNVTAISTNGLLRVLPHADVLPPVASLSEVTALLLGGPDAEVTERAAGHVASDELRKAVWVTTGLDAGDGIVTVVSSLRSALALYLARKSGKAAPAAWATHQGGDAVLKAVGIGHLLDLCFPGSEDPVLDLAGLPAGRALLAYFAAAEVALPFMEQLADGGHALERLIPEHLDAQVSKLSTVAGRSAVDAAQIHLDSITLTVDVLVSCAGEYIGPFVQSAEGAFPGAGSVVDTVGDVVAAGADVLPVYRFLGLRLVAETAVVRAARELGVGVPDSGQEWIAAYVDAPRRALMAASAEALAAEAGEGTAVDEVSSGDDQPSTAGGPDGAIPEPAGPADLVPQPDSSEAGSDPVPPSATETSAAEDARLDSPVAGTGAQALTAGVAAAATTAMTRAQPLEADAVGGGGVSVEEKPAAAEPPVVAPAPAPAPEPELAPSEKKAAPPPLPAAEPAPVPTPAPSEKKAAPPPLPAAEPAPVPTPAPSEKKAAPPPVATPAAALAQNTAPSSSAPVAPPHKTAPPPVPVQKIGPSPSTPRPPPPTKSAGKPQKVSAQPSKRVARVAPPPKPAMTARDASPRASSSPGEEMSQPAKSGFSVAAIGIAVALVALLGCAGVMGLGGVGALFLGAHEEATDEAKPGAGQGSKKAGKGSKKAGKGTKKAGKGSKQGKSKTGRKGGKRKGSGR